MTLALWQVMWLVSAVSLAGRLMRNASALERLHTSLLLWIALPIMLVTVTGSIHLLHRTGVFAGTLLLLTLSLWVNGPLGLAVIREDAACGLATAKKLLRRESVPVPFVVFSSLAIGFFSATCLPVWSSDALGYHLPWVYGVIDHEGLREVPSRIPYVNAYPNLINRYVVAFRLGLDTDQLLDATQVPFVLLLMVSLARILRRNALSTTRAFALAGLISACPIVFLQMSTNYVDIAFAAILVSTAACIFGVTTRAHFIVTSIAMGLLLGAKPSAPPSFLLAAAILVFRGYHTKRFNWALVATAIGIGIGGGKYIENWAAHDNPLWPVAFGVGPLHFVGPTTAHELASMALREPLASAGWLERIARSWPSAFPERSIYDMRIGGFGPVFIGLLVPSAFFGFVTAVRTPRIEWSRKLGPVLPSLYLVACALASPGAYWTRYSIAAFAGLLGLSGATLALRPSLAKVWLWVGAGLSTVAMLYSYPGLTGQTEPLHSLCLTEPASDHGHTPTREQRFAQLLQIDGDEPAWSRFMQTHPPPWRLGYDGASGLPGRYYHSAGGTSAVFLASAIGPEREHLFVPTDELVAWVRRHRLDYVVLGGPRAGLLPVESSAADQRPEVFRFLFETEHEGLRVYEVR